MSIVAFGQGFAQMASRLVKGPHIFVQGELTTREYDRTISVPNGKKSIDHVIQQLAVELKAETIRVLDRAGSANSGEVAEQPTDDVPCEGDCFLTEYKEVLRRLGVRRSLIGEVINLLREEAELVEVRSASEVSPDPDENPFALAPRRRELHSSQL